MTRRRAVAVVSLPVLLVTVLLAPARAQTIDMSLAVAPQGPATVTVGESGLAGQLTITNNSTGIGPVTLTSIVYNPSCGDFSVSCTSPDLGVASLAPTAAGTSGACAGVTFAVTGPDASGRFAFAPPSPVVLQPPGSALSACVIAFTFSVLKAPTIDSLPGTPGLQTTRYARVEGTAQAGGGVTVNGFATGILSLNVVVPPGGRYVPLTPTRILDTRLGIGGVPGPVAGGSVVDVPVTGRGGVPATGVGAVALNVTVTEPTSAGYLTVFPTGTAVPNASNLNVVAGDTVPNLVIVKVGTGGAVSLTSSVASAQVIFDVEGWFSDTVTDATGRFQPLVPARLLDTRLGIGGSSVRIGPGGSLDLQVAGRGGVPATGAQAAVVDLAVTNTTASSYVTVYPTGQPRPNASNLNFDAGETVANRVMATLGTGGKVTIYNNAGQADLIVDVGGWFTGPSTLAANGTFNALPPVRILDTRLGTGGITGPVPGGTSVDLQVTGRGGVPVSGVSAVVLNVTVTEPAAPGFLTVFPAGVALPNASDLNFAAGETRPNLVVVRVGTGGKVSIFTSASTQIVVDVAGWFV